MAERTVGTARLLWFFLWRTALWGASLNTLAGAVFGSGLLLLGIVGSLLFSEGPAGDGSVAAGLVYVVGAGIVFGAVSAVVGLVLGLLCGLMLFALSFIHADAVDPVKNRRTAGWACGATASLVVVVDWLINGYPNLEDFGFQRFIGDSITEPELSALTVVVYGGVPTLMHSAAMWVSGRRVASRYAREVGEAYHPRQAPTGGGGRAEGR